MSSLSAGVKTCLKKTRILLARNGVDRAPELGFPCTTTIAAVCRAIRPGQSAKIPQRPIPRALQHPISNATHTQIASTTSSTSMAELEAASSGHEGSGGDAGVI
mmetsp:Transcript_48064/g.108268  ORF Transcript_48064/g.108268 Transcript_48064/m.108268 type:complete len:104 (+) Transcript_48064:468-779(+)